MSDPSRKLFHAFKWSMASEAASKAVQPLAFIVLARLLAPEDFGVMAAAMMVIGFSQIFWEAGMGKALVQRQSDVDDAANAAFWINIALGLFVAIVLLLGAGAIAGSAFHDGRVEAVLQVMTLSILLGAVASVHVALLQKEMRFNRLFWVRFATVGLPGLASIPLAWYGGGYWALVIGMLIGQFVQVILLWCLSAWRPRLRFSGKVAGEMAGFGIWVGISGVLAWFYMWADSLIVGMYLGSHELGLYRTGNQFVSMFYALLFGPLLPVLYSHFSGLNGDRRRLGNAFGKVVKVLGMVSIPLAFLMFSFQDQLAGLVFGRRWDGIGLVVGVMALMHGFSWVVGANGEVYRAMGKPAYETIVTASTLVVYLIAYLVSIQRGFEWFVWTRLGLAIGAVFLHIYVAHRLVGLRLWPVVGFLSVIAALSSWSVVASRSLSWMIDSAWLQLVVGGGGSLLIVWALIFLLENKGVIQDVRVLLGRRVP